MDSDAITVPTLYARSFGRAATINRGEPCVQGFGGALDIAEAFG